MTSSITRFRIFPAVNTNQGAARPTHPQPPARGTPLRRDSVPRLSSIEVGGDTKPPGPSGLRDGFEY